MKKRIITVLLVFAFAGIGTAQDKVIDKAAYDLLMNQYRRPPSEWQGIARRITSETTDPTTGRNAIASTLKQVKEYDSAGNIRRVTESTVQEQLSRSETITVGTFTFSRRNLEPWKAIDPLPDRPNDVFTMFETKSETGREGTWVEPGAAVEFRVAAGEHKGESVLICSRIQKMEKVNASNGTKFYQEIVNKYWLLDRNRRMVKFEQITTSKGTDFEVRSVTVSEWQADPGIVIRAPIDVETRKP